MSEDLPTINVPLTALPTTIMKVLGVPVPEGLTPPIPMQTFPGGWTHPPPAAP